ncbi:radical SAM family heme chaperone HemW [Ravibacter arvi]|uniref:Heme chaperone HemW n=2 Tax=Ravibacter arvi TaxID=2051041 RepID=A0ABP8MDG7_9BACT
MAEEIRRQKSYLPDEPLTSVYFGGGTPSLLTDQELDLLLSETAANFSLDQKAEITLEANPDDLDTATILRLLRAGINRLSIGIQTFDDEMLLFLNRAHTGEQAMNAVRNAQEIGITNLSLDLIYALPAPDHSRLLLDLEKLQSLHTQHLSAYCLTIEPETAFGKWVAQDKMQPVNEEFAAAQFEITVRSLTDAGYEQYEISNFARDNQYSRHNSAYWQRKPYLGIGPSAHSFNGHNRQFNVSNNNQYLAAMEAGTSPATVELLTAEDQVNEYLLTGLRTKWGCHLDVLDQLSEGRFREIHRSTVKELVARGWMQVTDGVLFVTDAGKLFADRISSDLFLA